MVVAEEVLGSFLEEEHSRGTLDVRDRCVRTAVEPAGPGMVVDETTQDSPHVVGMGAAVEVEQEQDHSERIGS